MKTTSRIITALALFLICVTSIVAQNKKELSLKIEGQSTSINALNSSVNAINQQIGILMAKQEQQNEELKNLKKQLEELKTLIAATHEVNDINTGWTKQDKDYYCGLLRVQDDKSLKYGFIDKSGKLVIPCDWKLAMNFEKCGLARVIGENNLWGLIDTTGKIVSPCKWADMWEFDYEFNYELAFVKDENNLYGLIDTTGKIIHPCKWTYRTTACMLTKVRDTNGMYGCLNKKGQFVIPCKYPYINGDFTQNLIFVQDANGRKLLFDGAGKFIKEGW